MLCLQNYSEDSKPDLKDSVNNYYVYTDFFQNRKRNFALLTHSFNTDYRLNEINQIILNEVLKAEWKESSVEVQMKEIFQKLNWQLSNLFKQIAFRTAETLSDKNKNIYSKVNEKGLSLCFMMSYENRIYLVQFGRMLCGVIKTSTEGDMLEQIGEKWDNSRVKSQKELNLLGAESTDIKVPVHKIDMNEGETFTILFSGVTEKLLAKGVHPRTVEENLHELYKEAPYPYCLFTVPKKYEKGKSFIKIKAQTIGTIIITVLLISSVMYNLFGNREVENQLSILKTLIQENIRNTDIEDITLNVTTRMKELYPKFEQEKIEDFIQDYIKKMSQPAKEITIENSDSIHVAGKVCNTPLFDIKNLYVCTDKIVTSYSRRKFEQKWAFESDKIIFSITLIDGNRLLICNKDEEICLNRKTGEEIWRNKIEKKCNNKGDCPSSPVQISFFEEKRLNNSVLIRTSGKNIEFISSVDGSLLSKYTHSESIDMISGYDHVKKCLYAVSGNKVAELSVKIKN